MSVTEKLLAEYNAARGLAYPDKGYCYFADVRGNGGPVRRSVWTIINAGGGVTYSDLNGRTARERCAKIRAAIVAERDRQESNRRALHGVTLAPNPTRPWFPA